MPSGFPGFPPEAPKFLRSLKRNNRREWFQPRKHLYEQHVQGPMLELVAALNAGLARFAPDYVTDPKKAIFRIYRDTRFSHDKTPYKTHIAATFLAARRRGGWERAAFTSACRRTESTWAGGIWHPEPGNPAAGPRPHRRESHGTAADSGAKKTRTLMGELARR